MARDRISELNKRDTERVTGGDVLGTDITFVSNDSPPVEVSVKGIVTRHHLRVDSWVSGGAPGVGVNARNASCSVSEQLLVDAGYPVRDDNDEVDLKDHMVSWEASDGVTRQYVVTETFADEQVGVIVVICGEVEEE